MNMLAHASRTLTAAQSRSNFKTRLFVVDPKHQPWQCAVPYEGTADHGLPGKNLAPQIINLSSRCQLSDCHEGSANNGRSRCYWYGTDALSRSAKALNGTSSSEPALAGFADGGAERDRTDDLMLAKHALSQLSYSPELLDMRRSDGGPGRTRTSDLTLIRRAL